MTLFIHILYYLPPFSLIFCDFFSSPSILPGNTVELHQGETDLQIDGIKLGVDEDVPIPPLRMLLNKGKGSQTTTTDDTKSDNVNLVTIVTVSDNNSSPNRDHSVESDVLAHL